MTQDKKCVVCYKKGWINGRLCYGDQFDELRECCVMFKNIFFNTGNEKSNIWGKGNLYDSKSDGLNLVVRGGELKLLLYGEPISFCSWCGSGIEIRMTKNVTLKNKTKEVPDGMEEVLNDPRHARSLCELIKCLP